MKCYAFFTLIQICHRWRYNRKFLAGIDSALAALFAFILLIMTGCTALKNLSASPAVNAGNKPDETAGSVKVLETHDTYDLIQVPFERHGSNWNYLNYIRPHYPAGVERDIYDKIWACYVKTIERGDYDYDAYNKRNDGDPNWATPTSEFIDSPSYKFHGVSYQYSDYFEMLIRKEPDLIPLIDRGILRSESTSTHKYWVYQEPNRVKYYIDPTWGDWTILGTPKGEFAVWIEMNRRIEQSPTRAVLTEAIMRSWFFIQANAIGADSEPVKRNYERSAHNL